MSSQFTEFVAGLVKSNHLGYVIYKDGSSWCCADSQFVNLQESIAGFGDTPALALENYEKLLKEAIPYTFEGVELFLKKLYAVCAAVRSEPEAVECADFELRFIVGLLRLGHYSVCDNLLMRLDMEKVLPMVVINILSLTASVKECLPEREALHSLAVGLFSNTSDRVNVGKVLVHLK